MIAYAKTAEELVDIIGRELFVPFRNLLFAAAALVFLWGVVEFVANQENEDKKKSGRRHIFWGLVGLAIMFAVNGIVWVLINFISQLR